METWSGAEPNVLPTRSSLHKQGETPLGGSEAQQAAQVACAWCDGRFCPLLRLLDPPVRSVLADVAAPHRSLPGGAARALGRSWFSSPASAPCHAHGAYPRTVVWPAWDMAPPKIWPSCGGLVEGLWRSQGSPGPGRAEAVGVPGMGDGKPQGASGNLWGQEKEVGSRAAMRPGGHTEASGRHKRCGGSTQGTDDLKVLSDPNHSVIL